MKTAGGVAALAPLRTFNRSRATKMADDGPDAVERTPTTRRLVRARTRPRCSRRFRRSQGLGTRSGPEFHPDMRAGLVSQSVLPLERFAPLAAGALGPPGVLLRVLVVEVVAAVLTHRDVFDGVGGPQRSHVLDGCDQPASRRVLLILLTTVHGLVGEPLH